MDPLLTPLDFEERSLEVSYISDIHLEWRFFQEHCNTENDKFCTLQRIARTIGEQSTQVNLIAGDTADSVETFSLFVQQLSLCSKGDFFFVLGNHEYCGFKESIHPPTRAQVIEAEQAYKDAIGRYGDQRMHLIHNNLFFLGRDHVWHEISKMELADLSSQKLREAVNGAILVIFGSVNVFPYELKTFSSSEQDYAFLKRKVTAALDPRNLILLTHGIDEEFSIWSNEQLDEFVDPKTVLIEEVYNDNAILVCGHTHRNEACDGEEKRIYADNQIGCRGKVSGLKKFTLRGRPNLFETLEDGIHTISGKDYFDFFRGIGFFVPEFVELDHLTMIRRMGFYAFIAQTSSGRSFLLDFENILDVGETTPEQIYSSMSNYFRSLGMFLSDFGKSLGNLAMEISMVGGKGKTHGCIVDIDAENHVFLNPFDQGIVPYYAKKTNERLVFKNVPSLLRKKCPSIYRGYKWVIRRDCVKLPVISQGGSAVASKESFVETSGDMYKISRAVSLASVSLKWGILRFWTDGLENPPSRKQGESIVRGIACAERRKSLPKERTKKPKLPRTTKSIVVVPESCTLSKITTLEEAYKEKIKKAGDGGIVCLTYRGANKKADYRCSICHYEWSSRPDHLKDRYHCRCPKCSGVRVKTRTANKPEKE